ncbi:MAG: SH3 domain-containing protein, partial [Synergistaceae bacterium]|nr:SH3 domain-containing protein [Synergistaceae bacterium]
KQEDSQLFKDFQTIFPSDSRPQGREEEEEEETGESDELPPSPPHRVFVKPAAEDDRPVIKRPLLINPDDSYQEFSKYTRRRKRRRNSLLRRILGPLILLLAVAGSAWFLLGLRKVPEDDLPVPPPILQEDFYQPAEPEPSPVVDDEPLTVRIESPARGVVVGSNVNVRPDHSIAGAAITRLNADARVDLLDRWEGVSGNLSGPWFQIRTGGREGWIYGQYLQLLDARPATLPEGYTASLLKTFGATREELINSPLGQPTRQTATTLTWTGLTVNLRGEGEIARLQINSAKHVLLNSVAVGITDEQLYRNIGYPSDYRSGQPGQLRYIENGSQGMSVTMRDGRVQNITVGNI